MSALRPLLQSAVRVKRFQAIHHSSVDVAHGLALLFRGKSGRAADITGTTEFDPSATLRIEIPHRSKLLP
jgi:hypothetical protein